MNNNKKPQAPKLTPEESKELQAMPTSDRSIIKQLMRSNGISFQEAKDELSQWGAFM
jgi:hypothetical protein